MLVHDLSFIDELEHGEDFKDFLKEWIVIIKCWHFNQNSIEYWLVVKLITIAVITIVVVIIAV